MNESLMLREMCFNVMKASGAICIIGAFAGFSYVWNRQLKRRLVHIRDLIQLMSLLKGEIEYQYTALPEALIRIGGQVEGSCGEWFFETGQRMSHCEGLGFQELWNEQLEILKHQTDLKASDIADIERLGGQLSKPDRKTQLGALELYLDGLKRQENTLIQELPGKMKLVTTMSVLAALFIIVLLI